jgi:hypothetical protein
MNDTVRACQRKLKVTINSIGSELEEIVKSRAKNVLASASSGPQ